MPSAAVTVTRHGLSAEPSLDPQNERVDNDTPVRELVIPRDHENLELVEYADGSVTIGDEYIEADQCYAVAEFLIGKRAASVAAERLRAQAESLLRGLAKT